MVNCKATNSRMGESMIFDNAQGRLPNGMTYWIPDSMDAPTQPSDSLPVEPFRQAHATERVRLLELSERELAIALKDIQSYQQLLIELETQCDLLETEVKHIRARGEEESKLLYKKFNMALILCVALTIVSIGSMFAVTWGMGLELVQVR